MDFDECACSGKSLRRLVQPAVMAVLAKEALHGYLIAQRLQEMAMFKGQPPDPTGIYRILKAMEEDALVVSTWDLAETGPARRRFELTAKGEACLARWIHTLQEYQEAIEELLAIARTSVAKGL